MGEAGSSGIEKDAFNGKLIHTMALRIRYNYNVRITNLGGLGYTLPYGCPCRQFG